MIRTSLEIVIPIYNEGKNVIKLLNKFEEFVRINFRVLLCYDLDDDDIFHYKNELKKFKFEILFVKNSDIGPSSAIKRGLYFGNSDCVIVYPADDFLNINIIDKMYLAFKNGNTDVKSWPEKDQKKYITNATNSIKAPKPLVVLLESAE